MYYDAAHFTTVLLPVAGPGFRRRWGSGAPTPEVRAPAYYLAIFFSEKCMKMKGGMRA